MFTKKTCCTCFTYAKSWRYPSPMIMFMLIGDQINFFTIIFKGLQPLITQALLKNRSTSPIPSTQGRKSTLLWNFVYINNFMGLISKFYIDAKFTNLFWKEKYLFYRGGQGSLVAKDQPALPDPRWVTLVRGFWLVGQSKSHLKPTRLV